MKKLLVLFVITVFSCQCCAQEKKNYKALLKQLNYMLKNADEFSWMYEPSFEIIQPYKVTNDTLSVIIRGVSNDVPVTHKYEAPLNDLYDYVWDLYYVLSFNSNTVKVYELQNEEWSSIDERDFFHLGKLSDDKSGHWSKDFRKTLNKLYPLKNEFDFLD